MAVDSRYQKVVGEKPSAGFVARPVGADRTGGIEAAELGLGPEDDLTQRQAGPARYAGGVVVLHLQIGRAHV